MPESCLQPGGVSMRFLLCWCLLLVTGFSVSAWGPPSQKTMDCREKKILVMPLLPEMMGSSYPAPAEMAKIFAEALKASGLIGAEAFSQFPETHNYLYGDLASCFEMIKTEMPEYDGIICGTVDIGSNYRFSSLAILLRDSEGTLFYQYLLADDVFGKTFAELATAIAEKNRGKWEKIKVLPDLQYVYKTLPVKATKVLFIPDGAQLPDRKIFPFSDYGWWLAAARQCPAAFVLTETGDSLYAKMTRGVGEDNFDFPQWQWYDAVTYDDFRIERLNADVAIKSLLTLPGEGTLCKTIVVDDRCYLWYAGGMNLQNHKIFSLDFQTHEITPLAGGTLKKGVTGKDASSGAFGKFGSFAVQWPYAVGVFEYSLLIFNLNDGSMTELDDMPYDPKSAALLDKTLYVWMSERGGGALMKCALDGTEREILYDSNRPEKRRKLFSGNPMPTDVAVVAAPERGTIFLFSQNLIQECEPDGALKNATHFDYSEDDRYIQYNNLLFFAANYADRNGFATLDLKTGEIDGKFCFIPMPAGAHAIKARDTVHCYDRAFYGKSRGNAMVWNANSDLCFVLGKRSYLLNIANPEKSPLWAMPENQRYIGSRFDAYPSPDGNGFWIVSPLGYAAEILPEEEKSPQKTVAAQENKQQQQQPEEQK